MNFVLYFMLFNIAAVIILWIKYLAVMNLSAKKKEMNGWVKLFAYPVAIVAVILDAYINIIPATLVFFDIPREWMLTHRLERYKNCASGWRKTTAIWFCLHFLDPFDPSGQHCDDKCEIK